MVATSSKSLWVVPVVLAGLAAVVRANGDDAEDPTICEARGSKLTNGNEFGGLFLPLIANEPDW